MRRLLKYLAIFLAIVVSIAAFAAIYNSTAPLPVYAVNLPASVNIPLGDSTAIERGQKLVSLSCVICHLDDDGKLAGGLFPEEELGKIYVGNLTNHSTAGIGRYNDRELVHILRTGILPDGALLFPMMPRFDKMADDDLGAIIAYLRSDDPMVEADDTQWPATEPSFIAKALLRLAFQPAPMPNSPVKAPPLIDAPAHGEYLANAVLNCYTCHSASFTTNNDGTPSLSEGYYGGGTPLLDLEGNVILSANLTPHPNSGIGGWSLADFSRAIRSRQRPDGTILSDAMPLFAGLSEEEVNAIWVFLRTLPENDNNPRTAATE